MTVLEQMKWRYATKRFDTTRRISQEDWSALEEVLVLTPSSYGLQPWRFVVITDPGLRSRLLPFSWGQKQVVEASHLVVFTIKRNLAIEDIDRYIDRIAEVRQVAIESLAGFRRMLVSNLISDQSTLDLKEWATRQAYIALGNFMTAAAIMGIDTCPMEGIQSDQYDEILGLDALGLATVVSCPAGYRMQDDKAATVPKVRFKTNDVVLRIESE